MADEEDRQPPQSYDTVTPAGVGATTSNLSVPRDHPRNVWIRETQDLIDPSHGGNAEDLLYEFMESIPSADVIRESLARCDLVHPLHRPLPLLG